MKKKSVENKVGWKKVIEKKVGWKKGGWKEKSVKVIPGWNLGQLKLYPVETFSHLQKL